MMNDSIPSKGALWTGRALTVVVLIPMLASLAMKILKNPQMVQGFTELGLPMSMVPTLIVLELLAIVLYVIPTTAVMGTIVLTGYMGGAICTHLRVGQNVTIQTLIPILAWLSVYLRDPRLRSLIPLRK